MPYCQDPHCHSCRPPEREPETVNCKFCETKTLNIGTEQCDSCYEVTSRIERFVSHPAGAQFVLGLTMRLG